MNSVCMNERKHPTSVQIRYRWIGDLIVILETFPTIREILDIDVNVNDIRVHVRGIQWTSPLIQINIWV